MKALGIETVGMTMRFGAFTALENVTMTVQPGTVHALLGENGAGKSTLVKCIMGFYHATEGGLLVDGCEANIADPVDAQRLVNQKDNQNNAKNGGFQARYLGNPRGNCVPHDGNSLRQQTNKDGAIDHPMQRAEATHNNHEQQLYRRCYRKRIRSKVSQAMCK